MDSDFVLDAGRVAVWLLNRIKNFSSGRQKKMGQKALGLILDFVNYSQLADSFSLLVDEYDENVFIESVEKATLFFKQPEYLKDPDFILQKNDISQRSDEGERVSDYYDEEMLESLLEIFSEEAEEHLNSMCELILKPLNDKSVYNLYRGAHTIKGSAATVGLQYISKSSKYIEDFFHEFNNNNSIPNKIELFYSILSMILLEDSIKMGKSFGASIKFLFEKSNEFSVSSLISETDQSHSEQAPKNISDDKRDTIRVQDISRKILPPDEDNNRKTEVLNKDDIEDEMAAVLLEVFSTESEEHLSNLENKLEELSVGEDVIYDLFRITHTLKGAAATVGLNKIAEVANKLEDFFEEFNESGKKLNDRAVPLLFHASNLLRKTIKDKSDIISELDELLEKAKKIGSEPQTEKEKTPKRGKASIVKEIHKIINQTAQTEEIPTVEEKNRIEFASKFLKIPVKSIDSLLLSSDDLTLVRTQIEKSRDDFSSITSDLLLSHQTLRNYLLEGRTNMSEADRLERLQELEVEIAELIYNLEHSSSNLNRECASLLKVSTLFQQNLVSLRITTLEMLFAKLKQAIREIAFQTGKEVKMVFSGTHVELDKGVVDSLATPLLQIVRNAVTHGIELPSERRSVSKPAKGQIKVTAIQEGRFINITISDDGKGIDLKSIKKIIIEEGLVENKEELSSFSIEELLEAIFLPGFTTRSKADAYAGRGIGMNLVREKISKLGGDISVATIEGYGTDFTISVPVTTFVSQAILFHLGNEVYGIPISYVIEHYFYITSKPLQPGSRILWKGVSIPVVPLHHYFGFEINYSRSKPVSILILSHGGKYFGITVDQLVGIKDVTVKPLGDFLQSLRFFSGAIVSGAGTVQMIFNISYIAALARPALGFKILKKSMNHITAPKILVVDDSKSVREAASRVLANVGYETIKASDGWEAWNLLHEDEFDLVLTDLEMPRMTGYELITEIKRDSVLQDIPVVVLSSRTGEKSRKRVADAKADSFVTKPIKPLILLQIINKYVPIIESDMTRHIILFATTNQNKIEELKKLIEKQNVDIWGMDKFQNLPEVIEDGASFEENAIKKALERAKQTGLPSLADDSGLEVDALDGEPGIYSNRYGGGDLDDREKVDFLLNKMKGIRERKARFVSVIAFCTNPRTKEIISVRGECYGRIANLPRGESGFGYDPVFMLPNGKTFAELSMEEKNRVSHRADAFRKITPHLEKFINN